MFFPKPKKVNYNHYKENIKNPKSKLGLDKEIKFCKKCVISNQRPSSAIEFKQNSGTKKKTTKIKNSICDPCNYHDYKKKIDWKDREKQLIELCNKYRSKDGSYDCLVPGSGGKDSFYTSHILKNKYKMNPLTVTFSPSIYTTWGFNNFKAWIDAGHDNYLVTPNTKIHRLLTRISLENILHPFQPFILGQKLLPPKIASVFNIKLVFYGENEAEYGNSIKENKHSRRENKYFSNNKKDKIYIAGLSLDSLVNDLKISRNDLNLYLPGNKDFLESKKIDVRYLGYYLNWHPQKCYYYAAENSNFKSAPERTAGTYSKYNSIDDKIDDIHFYTYGIKFGVARATYDACQEIRNGDINRDEGKMLVKKYDHEFPKRFMKEILEYLSINKNDFPFHHKFFEQPIINEKYFKNLCDSFRPPHLWYFKKGKWKLRKAVWM